MSPVRGDEAATLYEHALADEILAEVARQRRTAKSVQDAAGVKPRAWNNYLTARVRHIPMDVVAEICQALGLKPSEMLARAEARVSQLGPPRVDVDKILRDSPHLAAVREEGQRLMRERHATTGE